MNTLIVPNAPKVLTLPILRLWNGKIPTRPPPRTQVSFMKRHDSILVHARGKIPDHPHIPLVPAGTRVSNLWHYDVVEAFLVGEGGVYLEIELGIGGHWLILGFSGIRHRVNLYEDLNPHLRTHRTATAWHTEISISTQIVPIPLRAINAFALIDEQYLAYAPLPGSHPDFHQPATFPAARIASYMEH